MNKFISANIVKNEDYNTLTVAGEMDLNTVEILGPKIEELLKDNKDILIDMEDVKFMDSTGLGTLVKLYKEQKLKDKKVTVINTKGNVRKIFKITYMEDMFNLGGKN